MTAAELLQLHATSRLASAGHHFKPLLKALDAGIVPEASHPEVQAHLPALREHLRQQGLADVDEALLRYALTIPGSQRGIDPPIEALTANRGGLSKARLREASSAVEYLQKGLLLARLVTGKQTLDALTLIKEASSLLPTSRKDLPSLIDSYLALNPQEASLLLEKAFELAAHPDEEIRELGADILNYLAGTLEQGLGSATDALAARGEFPSPHLFRGASDQAVQSILAFLENPGGQHRNLPLLALAWTRSETSLAAFRRWQVSPPAWADSLYIPPARYLPEAGLALNDSGNLTDLISGPCHLLAKQADPSETIPVLCHGPSDETCPGCANTLSWLFDFSAVPDRFLPWSPVDFPRKILNCHYCACYSPFFTRYAADGSASIHSATALEEPEEAYELKSAQRFLSTKALPTFVSSIPYAMENSAVLGGVPAWVQDAEYPSCPDCKMTMRFIGFFDNGSEQEEGVQYAFFCPACRVAAASYQQS